MIFLLENFLPYNRCKHRSIANENVRFRKAALSGYAPIHNYRIVFWYAENLEKENDSNLRTYKKMKGGVIVLDFNQIYNIAVEVINSTAASHGGIIEPNTPVCVISSNSGRVFNGVSHGGVHAEIEAVRNMQGFGENTVDCIILVDAASRNAMLPCYNCFSFIISQNPMNANAFVAMPDRMIPIQELSAQNPLGFAPAPQSRMFNNSMGHSSVVISGRSNGELLSGRLNSLMAAAAQEDSDEDKELLEELERETENKKKRGLFGGLFGKK